MALIPTMPLALSGYKLKNELRDAKLVRSKTVILNEAELKDLHFLSPTTIYKGSEHNPLMRYFSANAYKVSPPAAKTYCLPCKTNVSGAFDALMC